MTTHHGTWVFAMWSLAIIGCLGHRDLPVRPVAPPASAAAPTTTDGVRTLAHGMTVREVLLERPDSAMLVWIYRPAPTAVGPRPVILIASAGAPMIWGMKLGEGDRAEHLPWVERGYVVVAYSVDGHVDDPQSPRTIQAAIRAYLRASAGLDNARAALKMALAREPRADPDRVYTVGHGSAASLALRAGAELSEVKAIVAFNPITDIDGRIAAFRRELRQIDRRAMVILRESSPLEHLVVLRTKPVFLFHSIADEDVPVAESARLALGLKSGLESNRVLIVPTGSHAQSMLEQGLPAALPWLDALADPRPASHAAR